MKGGCGVNGGKLKLKIVFLKFRIKILFLRNLAALPLQSRSPHLSPEATSFVARGAVPCTKTDLSTTREMFAVAAHSARGLQFYVKSYAKLSKYRLSGLVAITAGVGYAMRYENAADDKTLPWRDTKLWYGSGIVTTGTWLSAACANTLNQIYERHSDALMTRTRARPMASGRLGLAHAILFAATTGAAGVGLLSAETNNTAAGLAAANIALYAGVYTPLKAMSTVNTTVGAVVGALPPLLGWAAASDGKLTGPREGGAWALAATLFLWQIPHFHALAVVARKDYAAAGLRMLAVSDPIANARWAWIASAAMIPLGLGYYMTDTTGAAFACHHAALSYWMVRGAKHLQSDPTAVNAARPLFRASIVHLPVVLALMMANKATYGKENEAMHDIPINRSETRVLLQPWEVMAPFPFLPVPRGIPAVVYEVQAENER